MNDTVQFIIDEYKLREPDKGGRVRIPKAKLKFTDISSEEAIKEIRNHPSIFDEGVIDKRELIVIPNINEDMIN